jgi:hypothetical protein
MPNDVRASKINMASANGKSSKPNCDFSSLRFAGVCWPLPTQNQSPKGASAYSDDVTRDGEPWIIISNNMVTLGISPAAGARAFVFQNGKGNAFTTTGGLRDDIDPAPTPSLRDFIAGYTHQFPAGTFNRPYQCRITSAAGNQAGATCSYVAPDLGVTFEREITMKTAEPGFTLRVRMTRAAAAQHGVLISALATSQSASQMRTPYLIAAGTIPYAPGAASLVFVVKGNAFGVYDPPARKLATVSWPPEDQLLTKVDEKVGVAIVRIDYPAGAWHDISFGYYTVAGLADASRIVQSLKGPQSGGTNGR